MVVATTAEEETLAEALQCDGPGVFTVSWNGDVLISRTISLSNGSTLDVTGSSSESTNGAVIGDGTVLLFEADLGSAVLLTSLTLSGGNGALSVAVESIVEVVDCIFMFNNKTSTSSYGGGGLTVLFGHHAPIQSLAVKCKQATSFIAPTKIDCTSYYYLTALARP